MDSDEVRRRLLDERARNPADFVGRSERPSSLPDSVGFQEIRARVGELQSEQFRAANRDSSKPRPFIGGIGSVSIAVGDYNIINPAHAATVNHGNKGPLTAYGISQNGQITTHGDILLIKFTQAYKGTRLSPGFYAYFQSILWDITAPSSGHFPPPISTMFTELDVFYLLSDYDPTTICWNNQPFGLTTAGFAYNGYQEIKLLEVIPIDVPAITTYNNAADDAKSQTAWLDNAASSIALNFNATPFTASNTTTWRFHQNIPNGNEPDLLLHMAAGTLLYWRSGTLAGLTSTVSTITLISTVAGVRTYEVVTVDANPVPSITASQFVAYLNCYGIGLALLNDSDGGFPSGLATSTLAAFPSDPEFIVNTEITGLFD